ncbi:hypothetical protein L195_g051016 [Trifolium pratense]|uniref:Uncharacterized protein n=1 Tax=Trifolium pratense TaxID=57577 RepID=A0A2K3JX55_TRIPR|nr:hypothetical protein L195_g051016 [Trifolium pratense]
MKRFSARIAEFRRKKDEEQSESEEDEIDADYAEFLAGYVPKEEQEEEDEEQNPEPIEISSDDSEAKSEIFSESLSE